MNQYQTKHLLLLVGSNPLPNAIAAERLATPETTITLLHSENSFEVAQRLQSWIQKRDRCVPRPVKIDESDPASIFHGVWEELTKVNGTSIGLHYTGGTKAMSVHAYRAVEFWCAAQKKQGRNVRLVFSYLNPRKLQMVIDPFDPQSRESPQPIATGSEPKLKLSDLLELHGWSFKHDPKLDSFLPVCARALAKTCAQKEAFADWNNWISKEVRSQCRTENQRAWLEGKKLPAFLHLPNDIPSVVEVVDAFRQELSLPSGNLALDQPKLAQPGDKEKDRKSARRFCEWLGGKWLEDHTLDEIKRLSDTLEIHQSAQNIETQEVQFDVDVVALRGYQLFALSCSTDDSKSLLKSKLFEAYIRARQLGGDEARVALICCSEKPKEIEQEMRRDVDPEGRIRVFGREHLADLGAQLAEWITEQSKGK